LSITLTRRQAVSGLGSLGLTTVILPNDAHADPNP